ncbi:MAG: transporter [Gammaproteobacteria bacterium]|nr:transporter [Gammaproteobacteria bacterium]
MATMPAAADDPPVASRVEARSADMLAVGIVHGDHMAIRLSRSIDNAPVHDAALAVLLRGAVHPTVAEADGSYSLRTKDLEVPGSASIEFQVVQGQARESLKGALLIAGGSPKPEEKNSARQLWWWVLNFAVCIGFLMLLSRRRKAAPRD